MATPVTIIPSGGSPFTPAAVGPPFTPVVSGGIPITLVAAGASPIKLVNVDLSPWSGLFDRAGSLILTRSGDYIQTR